MSHEPPREIAIEYAQSRAGLDKFMAFVSKSGNGKPLTFDAFHTPKGWQVIMICLDRGVVHPAAQARRFSREMRAAIRRKWAHADPAEREAANVSGAFAICDAWDLLAKLALERNRAGIKPN